MRYRLWTLLAILLAMPVAAGAQILPLPTLPNTGGVTGQVGQLVPRVPVDQVLQSATDLAQARIDRLQTLVRRNPDRIALDRQGNPVRAGEVVLTDPDDASIAAAQAAGFRLIERDTVPGLDIGFARFAAPRGMSIESALKRMRKAAPDREVSADPLHFASGGEAPAPFTAPFFAPAPFAAAGARVGIIDGGVNTQVVAPPVTQTGFATGAPYVNDHATGIASLISGGSGVRAAALGSALYVADVYGRDPAGGNATAIARAIGWLVTQQVEVITVSLVGPANPLLARTIAAAQARGVLIVAAVGNDGPAAPPSYPASYPGVIAVTGVDGHDRALIEAGRAEHLDYAAPGADMLAANSGGRLVAVRGTSFAAPLVAARIAATGSPAALDREARDLGPRGPDRIFGRGLVCGDCRTSRK
ncbi:S8 family serine peptidase [Sphingomonas sp. LB-2]|uniref:S8 family serine peptidase n=1 Tax=Sphingomonas caeni TaxID=2984949 RepID=UPI0022314133|nr:S8 family serine peptidase [Sphingomonas caeni]MCW3849273.1 S8 family serine peptidase [Sphingomonas caeni]